MKKTLPPNLVSAGLIILTLLAFFALNVFTPLIADDFNLAFVFNTHRRIASLGDIAESLYHYYFEWGGRVPAFFFGELLVMLGKPVFNICNTLVYGLLMLLLYFHAFGSLRPFKPFAFLALNGLVWFLTPSWGEDFLWLNGSVVYLWPAAAVFAFLAPYRKRAEDPSFKPGIIPSAFLFLLGILAGWGNENWGASVLLLLIAYGVLKRRKKEKPALFEVLGLLGFLAGFALLLLSPGTHFRTTTVQLFSQYHPLVRFFLQAAMALYRFFEAGFVPAAAAALVCVELVRRQKKAPGAPALLYGIAGFTGFFSMAVSPEFPARASFAGVIFLCTALVYLLRFLDISGQIQRNLKALYVLAFVVFAFSFANAGVNSVITHTRWRQRIEYIASQKEQGSLDVRVREPIHTKVHTAFNTAGTHAARGNDISTDPGYGLNRDVAAYFGINSIRGLENDDSRMYGK